DVLTTGVSTRPFCSSPIGNIAFLPGRRPLARSPAEESDALFFEPPEQPAARLRAAGGREQQTDEQPIDEELQRDARSIDHRLILSRAAPQASAGSTPPSTPSTVTTSTIVSAPFGPRSIAGRCSRIGNVRAGSSPVR